MLNEKRIEKIERVLKFKQPSLEVFLDNVDSSQNISAIIRSCDGVGILNFYYANREDKDTKIHKTITQGSHHWLYRKRIDTDRKVNFLKEKQKDGFQVVVTYLNEKSISYRELDYTKKTLLVMGNEHEGTSAEVLALADEVVLIPMRGMAQSLNVSVATALLLYEAERQLLEAGFYEKAQLTFEEREKIKFEWIHRDLIVRRSKGTIFTGRQKKGRRERSKEVLLSKKKS
jgi:tRNA (guanosine-2'-O-)-methyltransferase